MTRRVEDFVRRLLYVGTTIVTLGAVGMSAYLAMHQPEPLAVQWVEQPIAVDKKAELASSNRDPMISKLAASRMSKTVVQSVVVHAKPPAPSLSMLLRVRGIMDFGDPKASEAIIESVRGNSTKNYKVNEHIDGVEATVLKIDKQVTFSYDGKEIQLGVNADVGVELPVADRENAPALSDNRGRADASVKCPRTIFEVMWLYPVGGFLK